MLEHHPSVSPSQSGKVSCSMITGIRSCIAANGLLASVVMVAKVRNLSPSGDLHSSHTPLKATGTLSARAMEKGYETGCHNREPFPLAAEAVRETVRSGGSVTARIDQSIPLRGRD
jgi:hypothetical protein